MNENKEPVTTSTNEIVVLQNQSLSDMTDDIIASAQRRIANIEKIITLSLKITNVNDWVDQQGKPYLVASGAEKIARLFGVSWKILDSKKVISDDENGNFYFYQVTGVFTLLKDTIEAIGTCSSKDQFFAKVSGEFKQLSNIDETNIMKSAYTNCVSNGITRILGIRNLTWEQVKSSGVDQSKVASIKYASGGAGGGKISDAQGKRLWALSKKGNKSQTQLKEYLKNNYKIEHSKDLERKDYDAVCAWAEAVDGKVEPEEDYVPE